jgi:hypothetical protein
MIKSAFRIAAVCSVLLAFARGSDFDAALEAAAPGVQKWATVCIVSRSVDGTASFAWHDYAESGWATDFWPASTIKLYAVLAALELVHEQGLPLESAAVFEHRTAEGRWVLDCARTIPEMLHAVFQRSSNEDYTLLLRLVGIDRINTQFLAPERGFPHSALMRGYVLDRPNVYVRTEPQRITLRGPDGKTVTIEHTWSGHSYSADRGATIFDAKTGNVTSPRELAECLRRVLFAESLPEKERYRISPAMLEFLRHGGDGLCGLENKGEASGPHSWLDAADAVFPKARFYHKCGEISNYALEVACIDDSAQSGKQFILVPVVAAGSESKPVPGAVHIRAMSRVLAEWVRDLK